MERWGEYFAALVLKEYGEMHRNVWVCDSFEGFPPESEKDKQYNINWPSLNEWIAVPVEDVKNNFSGFGVLNDNVKFVKGFFKETMLNIEVKNIAVLRLDGDMYDSTMDVLNALYFKVSKGGYVIIDDYGISSCDAAVNDFRAKHNILSPMISLREKTEKDEAFGCYWKV